MAAPQIQEMSDSILHTSSGFVVRQEADIGEIIVQEAFGLPCQKQNKYMIAPLPPGKRAIHNHQDKAGWRPTGAELEQIPKLLVGQEQSSLCQRVLLTCCGCGNLRPLSMPFKRTGTNTVEFYLSRPFNLGGSLCCPHTTFLEFAGHGEEKRIVGKVEEDCHCGENYCQRGFQLMCCCTDYFDLSVVTESGQNPKYEKKYQLVVNLCLCGPHSNFCGATCIKNDMLFNVYPYVNGKPDVHAPVGWIQKTFGTDCSCTGLARMYYNFDNFLVEFPANATIVEKGLFLASVINAEYVFFERQGTDN